MKDLNELSGFLGEKINKLKALKTNQPILTTNMQLVMKAPSLFSLNPEHTRKQHKMKDFLIWYREKCQSKQPISIKQYHRILNTM